MDDALACSEDGKTITVTYAEPFADWQSVFSGQIPAHVIERESGVDDLLGAFEADDIEAITAIAETYNTLYTVNPGEINDDTMLSGGKFAIGAWEPGASITLVPNEAYWGTPAEGPVVIRIIAEEAQSQALANGEINAMDPQPSVDLIGQLDAIDGVIVETGNQYIWEHFDFNFNSEIWSDIQVREAFAKCLPREQMVEALIQPVNPEAEVLNNRWIQPFEDGYQDNSGGVSELDLEAAQALLDASGVAQPVPVRLGWFDNGGNQRRTDQVALTIESCNQIGFDIQDAGSETFFDVELAAGDWDIAMFAWAGSPLKSGAVSHLPVWVPATMSATSTSRRSSRSSTELLVTTGSAGSDRSGQPDRHDPVGEAGHHPGVQLPGCRRLQRQRRPTWCTTRRRTGSPGTLLLGSSPDPGPVALT